MQCHDFTENFVAALYGEAEAQEHQALDEHLKQCGDCRAEWQAFHAVREDLKTWRAPDFQHAPGRQLAPSTRWGWLAAAAVLLLSLGGALRISGLQIESGPAGLVARFGARPMELEPLATAQEQQGRELASLRAALQAQPLRDTGAQDSDALLIKVRELVAASELRQRQQWQALLSEAHERLEAERRFDRARVAASLSYLEGRTGQHMARTTQLVGYMLEASQPTER